MKQLSKVVAIFMIVACALAFMPLLNGQAFAAAKKPAKITKVTVKVTGTTAKITWKKSKNAKKYNVKIDGKVVKKKLGKKTYTAKNLKAGTHKVQIQALNGSKKAAYSKVKSFKVAATPTPTPTVEVASVAIDNTTPNIGDTLTATLLDKDGNAVTADATYQWYRIAGTSQIAIPGATEPTYIVSDKDANNLPNQFLEGYSIYVEVTVNGKTYKSAETDFVSTSRVLDSVAIVLPNGHEAPMIGDTLSLTVMDKNGKEVKGSALENYNITWYVNGAEVEKTTRNGAAVTALNDTLTVTAAYKTKVITAKVAALKNAENYLGEVMSDPTAPVIETVIPSELTIGGAVGIAPAVGEILTADFNTGASDPAATYQWYRLSSEYTNTTGAAAAIAAGVKISGATASTYTVTTADEGAYLAVVATLSTDSNNDDEKDVLYGKTSTKAVQKALKGAKVTVAISNPQPTDRTTVLTKDTLTATVEKADSTYNGDAAAAYTYEWYLDSVADANKLCTDVHKSTIDPDDQTMAGSNGTLALETAAYLKGETKEANKVDYAGHKLIVVATSSSENKPQGSVTSDATSEVKIQMVVTDDAIKNDTGDAYYAGQTTLYVDVPKVTIGSTTIDPTATYQWYSYEGTTDIDADSTKWIAISGANQAEYKIPTDVIATGEPYASVQYKVVVEGTGNFYYANAVAPTTRLTITMATGKTATTVAISGKNGNAVAVQAGDVLTAAATPKAAQAFMTYSWVYTTGETTQAAVTGESYTVPADATAGSTVVLSAKSTKDDYANASNNVTATVQGKITGQKLVSSADTNKSTGTQYNGVQTPSVGETLTVVTDQDATFYPEDDGVKGLKVEWFAEDKKISTDDATDNNANYTLTEKELGKTVYAVVSVEEADGTGTQLAFIGAKAKTEATGTVKSVEAATTVKLDNKAVSGTTKLYKTDSVTASVAGKYYAGGELASDTADISSEMAYKWYVGGTEVTNSEYLSDDGATYTIQPEDAGKDISCVASNANVTGTDLTWTYGGEVSEGKRPQ